MEALIIPPVTEKTTYFRNETVGRVWWEAAQALRHAARVFVIGYALARSDLGMRAFSCDDSERQSGGRFFRGHRRVRARPLS